jgi:putative spermidine/putrescine transport system substrate-binding protein
VLLSPIFKPIRISVLCLRRLIPVFLSAFLLFVNAGGAIAVPTAGASQSVGEGEGALSILAWPGYIERGETDPSYDWVTAFEKETSCAVNVKTVAT